MLATTVTLTPPSYVIKNNNIRVSIVLSYKAYWFVYNYFVRSRVASVLASSLSPVWQATRTVSFCRDRPAISIFELKTVRATTIQICIVRGLGI